MLANMAETVHIMPSAGGLLDQHPYHVLGIYAVLSARSEKAEKERKDQERQSKRK